MSPRALDLFSKAGGTSYGLYLAGFDVVGVDLEPQPRYPFEFHQADALTYPLDGFDLVVAGPPCQDYSATRSLHTNEYPRLIAPVRERLIEAGVPYIIENVERARPELRDPVMLCGSSFGLGVRRHRLFEVSFPVELPPSCSHDWQPEPVDVTGTGARRLGPRTDGKGGNSRKPYHLTHARSVMCIPWMNRRELAEAIPPVYALWLGAQARLHLDGVA